MGASSIGFYPKEPQLRKRCQIMECEYFSYIGCRADSRAWAFQLHTSPYAVIASYIWYCPHRHRPYVTVEKVIYDSAPPRRPDFIPPPPSLAPVTTGEWAGVLATFSTAQPLAAGGGIADCKAQISNAPAESAAAKPAALPVSSRAGAPPPALSFLPAADRVLDPETWTLGLPDLFLAAAALVMAAITIILHSAR